MGKAGRRSFGDLLRRYRVASGLTQETLAERAGMSLATIGKLERGAHQRPYLATVALLAEALSLNADDRLELERAANRGVIAESTQPDLEASIHLPIHFSTFVGRERDLEGIHELLAAHRLVTLVGPGGVGKTRLAIRSAEHFVSSDATGRQLDAVWFADLSSITDDVMLAMTLASSSGVGQSRTIGELIPYLRSRAFLLILDNCEHLLDLVAPAAEAILLECPGARILATSREPIALEAERVYRVPPLPESDAIQLFKDRAEATDSRFELSESVLPAVAEICERVDGIALAIELAAARIHAFSPATIAEQIGEHLSLLSGGVRTSLARHKTMHALFDWSYQLLDDRERELFRRSSIFLGGFTLDLVRSLYADPAERSEIATLLASLVDKSFVQCDILVEPTRYRLLEPVRQYANEKLRERGEHEAAARSHAIAMLSLAEDFDARLELIPDRVWDGYIDRERDNFRSAFEWTLGARGDMLVGQRLAASRTATWGGFASGDVRKWIGVAREVSRDDAPPDVFAKLTLNAARAAVVFGPSWEPESNPETRVDACRYALALQQPGDVRAVGTAKYWLGVALQIIGRYDEADKVLREARVAARSVGAEQEYNAATSVLGGVRYGVGDLQEAHELAAEVLRRSEEAGSQRVAADARATLSEIAFAMGRVREALDLSEETTRFFRLHGNLIGIPLTLSNSAAYLVAMERYDEARDYAREALQRSRAIGSAHCAFWAMQHLAAAAVFAANAQDDALLRRAATLLGFVDETTAHRGIPRYHTEQQEYDKLLAALDDVFGSDELMRLIAAGKTWSEERAVAEALEL